MNFKINDLPATKSNLPPTAQKMYDTLNSLPDGELITSRNLSAKINYTISSMRQFTGMKIFNDYKVKYGPGLVWGNKKTITAFREEYGL